MRYFSILTLLIESLSLLNEQFQCIYVYFSTF